MKQVAILLLLVLNIPQTRGQMLFYQDTYKGGICADGHTYASTSYFGADTIKFQNTVPAGATIRKAFLISWRGKVQWTQDYNDTPRQMKFNNNNLVFDSSDIVTNIHYCSLHPIGAATWGLAKDVTNLTLNSGNILITPTVNGQICNYGYDGFLLLILYDNISMPITNVAIYTVDKTYDGSNLYPLNSLNPIDTTRDVGLSIVPVDVNFYDTMRVTLNSSQGNYYLGRLNIPYSSGAHRMADGSFYYQNNTLFGLEDDTPDAFIDSTDALANIKSYLANNTTSFDLIANYDGTNVGCTDLINALILAYSTPCPPLQNIPTQFEHICGAGNSVQLSAVSTGGSYSWYTGYALSDSTIINPVASPTLTTNYIVTVTDSLGCHHTEMHRVSVKSSPSISNLTILPATCAGWPGQVTISSMNKDVVLYGVDTVIQSGNVFYNLSAGNYTATVTNDIGCVFQQPFTIPMANLTNATFAFSPDTFCVGNSTIAFSNLSTNVNSYSWYINDSLFSTMQNPAYTFPHSGNYTVTLISYWNQPTCSDTASRSLIVHSCYFDITYPNVFTPNGDGINDTWQPVIRDLGYQVNDYSLIIYDRWGLKIFEASDIMKGWDAHTTSGIECKDGTYYYLITYQTASPTGEVKRQTQKGFLQLIR
jgi:gliding motility-associated-like protein